METHFFIKLAVDAPLNPTDARLWLETVQQTLPSGLLGETEIIVKGEPKSTAFYQAKSNGHYCYIVPLTRNPAMDEVESVARAWGTAYPEGDFEIDYSNLGETAAKIREVKDAGLKEIAIESAKLLHNVWLTEMSESGWSYGTKFSQMNKKNPNMLPWEQVSKRYQLQEMRRFEKLLEVLQSMGLKLGR